MKSLCNRRDFLKNFSQLGVCCAFFLCHSNGLAGENSALVSQDEKKALDLDKLTYCGHQCDEKCNLLKATIENDVELKKKVFAEWKFKERFGVEFDPEIVFCHGCKVEDRPLSIILKECTVRKCAIDREVVSCVQCKELKDCEKDLWTRFPKFKEYVEGLQKKYVESGKNKLL